MEFLQSDQHRDCQGLIERRALLHTERTEYRPRMPAILKGLFDVVEGAPTECLTDTEKIKAIFPMTFGQPKVSMVARNGDRPLSPLIGRKIRVGVVFSGGPAPGGHNVLTGLLDFIKRRNRDSQLIGFVGGPGGIVDKKFKVITEEDIETYRNLGGFHYLGSGRTKIETEAQLQSSMQNCADLQLDGLIVVGGDDSNTNAGILAEYFLANSCRTSVIGVPKTIDGDLRNEDIEASFGFDTATKVYAASVSNLCFDAISALKSYHFVRVMGRDASHITLEVALQTHPNLLFISEEVAAAAAAASSAAPATAVKATSAPTTVTSIVNDIVSLIVERAKIDKHYGVVLIPEGLVGFVPDMKALISELNEIMGSANEAINPTKFDTRQLSEGSAELYASLPEFILRQMMAERDPHGNVQVSAIETERLLGMMVRDKLDKLSQTGVYKGKFTFVPHYFGYEGRCAFPSKFDCDYCYTLGATAGALVESKKTGFVASVRNLDAPSHAWLVGGSPLTSMMNIERRKGKDKPVIKKKLVDLTDAPFQTLQRIRESWKLMDDYRMPGAIQHAGGTEDDRNATLLLEAEVRKRTRLGETKE